MHIALVHAFCWPEVRRGGERYLHETAGALQRRGHDVTIYASASSRGTWEDDGVQVVAIRRTGRDEGEGIARFGRRVLPRLLRHEHDAVHALVPSAAAAAIWAGRLGRAERTVYTNLGLPHRWFWDAQPDRRHHEQTVARIDVYGCLSRAAQQVLEADYGRVGALTPGGVRLDRFGRTAERAARPTILYASSLDEPRKGVATLLEAVDRLRRDVPDVALWLCGPGDADAVLADAPAGAVECTEVLPLGTPDLADLYSQAWCTALPAVHEAFGLVLVESLACGTPIVGGDHSALPELVSDDIGALAEPGDAESLAHALRRVLELAQEPGIGERCRAAAAPYDWETELAPRLEALYRG